jgi:hypothetical protein
MDSLTAMELHNRLQGALGRSLSSTLAFKHPTMDSLAGALIQELYPPIRNESSGTVSSIENTGSGVSGLISDKADETAFEAENTPEEDLEGALSKELKELEIVLNKG